MKNSNNSKEKILLTACRLFAKKGYKSTTIRAICKEANTYQISINYYFKNKENLFKKAMFKAYELTEDHLIEEKIKNLTPDETIEFMIRNRIEHLFGESQRSWFFKILSKEFHNHPELIQSILKETLHKHKTSFKNILRKIAKKDEKEEDIEYSFFLILSQIFTLACHPMIKKEFLEFQSNNIEKRNWLIQKIKKSITDSLNYSELE